MKLITISGLDGSGKSTQVEMLKNYLESQGKKVFYFHAIEQGVAKKIVDFRNKYCLLCRLSGKCKTSNQKKSVTKANWLAIQLRKIFLKIDLCRFKKLIKKLEKQSYDYLVSDRYFYDSIVNIEYLSAKRDLVPNWGLSPLKPNLSIYLQLSPDSIMQRDRIPDQGIEYLKRKKELYEKKIGLWNMKVVDGNRDKNVIFEEIQHAIPSS
jgi:thymidylate kinase